MRSYQQEYNAIQFLNAWASTGSQKMLRAFLSSIFLAGKGLGTNAQTHGKALDSDALMSNFYTQLHKEKQLLVSHKEILARLILDLREVINPIIFPEDEENSRIQNYIRAVVLSKNRLDNDEYEINSFIQEATISAAMKISEFSEILAQEMELDFEALKEEAEKESRMEKILITDSPRFLAKSAHHNLDLESVIADVLYEECVHYILYNLGHNKNKKIPSLALPPLRTGESSPLSSARLSPLGLHKIDFLHTGIHSGPATGPDSKENVSWQIAELIELFAMTMLFPFSCLLAEKYSLVGAIKNKSMPKLQIAAPVPVRPLPLGLFNNLEGTYQGLPRPSELLSSRGEESPVGFPSP